MVIAVALVLAASGAAGGEAEEQALEAMPTLPGKGWRPLFDGKTLKGWTVVEKEAFDSHAEVKVEKGAVLLNAGMPFTGVVCKEKFPSTNFELAVDALRRSGSDIFCGVTFPVGKSAVTLVLGGWGDTVVGLSSVDDQNASNNETMRNIGFKNKRWYRVRVRVTDGKIEVWIGSRKVVELARPGRRFSVYEELEVLRPFGFFSWRSEGSLRNIRVRELTDEVAALPPLAGKGWAPLYDGKTLKGWKVVAEGEREEAKMAAVADGLIVCRAGFELTGVAWQGKFPTMGYEVAVDAMKVAGGDFFCGVTFPIGKMSATLVVGGWGGTTVGISNVNDFSANENETTRDMEFQKGRWYRVRLRVTPERLEAWIDKEQVVDLKTKGLRFTLWLQQEAYRPFGINAYQTKAALRSIMLRRLGKAAATKTPGK